MYSFSYLEPVCCSMSSSNCCFLTCIQISQEAGQVVWYSHLFQNFPQLIVIHTVKGFGIVNKAEIELSCFFHDPADVGNLISGSSAFPKTSLNIWKFTYCWTPKQNTTALSFGGSLPGYFPEQPLSRHHPCGTYELRIHITTHTRHHTLSCLPT